MEAVVLVVCFGGSGVRDLMCRGGLDPAVVMSRFSTMSGVARDLGMGFTGCLVGCREECLRLSVLIAWVVWRVARSSCRVVPWPIS